MQLWGSFIRESLSVATLGTAVNYRSKSERKLKVTGADSKAAIAADQTRLSIERQRAQTEMIAAPGPSRLRSRRKSPQSTSAWRELSGYSIPASSLNRSMTGSAAEILYEI